MKLPPASTIARGIVGYIFQHSPQSYDQLHDRAKTKDWYNRDRFDRAMVMVGKYPNISVGKNLIYKAFTPKRRELPTILGPLPNKPRLIPGVNDASHEIFDDLCFCGMFFKPDEEIKHHCKKHGVQ